MPTVPRQGVDVRKPSGQAGGQAGLRQLLICGNICVLDTPLCIHIRVALKYEEAYVVLSSYCFDLFGY